MSSADPVVPLGQQRLVAAQRVAAEQHVLADGHLREQRVRLGHLGDALGEHAGAAELVQPGAVEVDRCRAAA